LNNMEDFRKASEALHNDVKEQDLVAGILVIRTMLPDGFETFVVTGSTGVITPEEENLKLLNLLHDAANIIADSKTDPKIKPS